MLYHLLLTLMALYHYSAQIISRSAGKSAVAAAAYRAGEKLWDERYGKQYDYRKKQGVAHSEILLPVGAPDWMSERQMLWNQIEAIEKHTKLSMFDYVFFPLHTEVDDEHGLILLRIAEELAKESDEAAMQLRKGMLKALNLRASYWDNMYDRAKMIDAQA